MPKRAFTLIEMMLAVAILGIMTAVAAISFSTVLRNWSKSEEVVDRMQGAEYLLTQVIAGLRSAYYPNDGSGSNTKSTEGMDRGLMLIDGGDGEEPDESDVISWTKLGGAIVGDKSQLAETAHRVSIWVSEDGEGDDETPGLYARVWEDKLLVTDDLSESERKEKEESETFLLAEDVVGFDCKVQKDETAVDSDGRPDWKDTWDESNCIPYRVKLTFRMKPAEGDKEPLPIIRVFEIPVWELSQGKFSSSDSDEKNDSRRSERSGGDKGGGTAGGKGGAAGGRGGGGQPGGTGPRGPAGGTGPRGPAGGTGPRGPMPPPGPGGAGAM